MDKKIRLHMTFDITASESFVKDLQEDLRYACIKNCFKNNKVWDKESYHKLDKKEKKKHDFGQCGSCRACWSREVKQVSYKEH